MCHVYDLTYSVCLCLLYTVMSTMSVFASFLVFSYGHQRSKQVMPLQQADSRGAPGAGSSAKACLLVIGLVE